MGTLDGKAAIVTGAGQGVGEGIALALAREGATVAAVGRTLSKVESTAEAVHALGGKAIALECDVAVEEQLSPMVEAVTAEFGGVDILINNANYSVLGPVATMNRRHLDKSFAVGPLATLTLMQLCRPLMIARGGGSIVNLVSSAAVRWDLSNYGGYAAAKEAMRSLSRAAAVEWGRDDIRVNAVAPHALSPGLKKWTEANPVEAEEFIAAIPMARIGECEEDIGRAVAAMCGPDFRYLTGATIPLDGGQARWA